MAYKVKYSEGKPLNANPNFLAIEGKWEKIFKKLPRRFLMIVYGESASGKTEFVHQFSQHLKKFGRGAWISYEQGHGEDLDDAIRRNEIKGGQKIAYVHPQRDKEQTLFDGLINFLSNRKSPEFIYIDSVDKLRLTVEQWDILLEKFGKKKSFVFISHEKNGEPATRAAIEIKYEAMYWARIRLKVAHFVKNRFGNECIYVIHEEGARGYWQNKKYFDKVDGIEEKKEGARNNCNMEIIIN